MIDDLRDALERLGEDPKWVGHALSWTRLQREGRGLTLTLHVRTDAAQQVWRVSCTDVEEFRFVDEDPAEMLLEVTTDHPYLWPYQFPFAWLRADVAPEHADTILGVLYRTHEAATYGGVPMDPDLMRWPLNGRLITSGPLPLMEAYRDALQSWGLNGMKLENRGQVCKRWDGRGFVSPDPPPAALLLGSSFVLAAEFNATRVS